MYNYENLSKRVTQVTNERYLPYLRPYESETEIEAEHKDTKEHFFDKLFGKNQQSKVFGNKKKGNVFFLKSDSIWWLKVLWFRDQDGCRRLQYFLAFR